MWGTSSPGDNLTGDFGNESLTPHLSAIVACFVFWRGICHPAFSDFFNTICRLLTRALQQTTCTGCDEFIYSITSSAMESTPGGSSMPSARAVCRLMTNANSVDWITGRSAGLAQAGYVAARSRQTCDRAHANRIV